MVLNTCMWSDMQGLFTYLFCGEPDTTVITDVDKRVATIETERVIQSSRKSSLMALSDWWIESQECRLRDLSDWSCFGWRN